MRLKFDIVKAQTGKYRIVTRSGVEVHKIVWFKGVVNNYCLRGIAGNIIQSWNIDGNYMTHNTTKDDLFLIKKP